jgi:hypothetical protein
MTDVEIIDGRKSAWGFRASLIDDVKECAKNATSIYSALGTNAKTGRRLMQREPVRHDVARGAANAFLDFLFEIQNGAPIDMSKFNVRIVKQIASKYTSGELGWKDLIEQVEGEARKGPPSRKAA